MFSTVEVNGLNDQGFKFCLVVMPVGTTKHENVL